LPESGLFGLGKVKTIGPFCPRGASCTCTASGLARLCVHCTESTSAAVLRSAVQLPVVADVPGGTVCAELMLNETMSIVRRTICPRIAPAGRPEVWMFT
jgi:hypothetical protein